MCLGFTHAAGKARDVIAQFFHVCRRSSEAGIGQDVAADAVW